MSSPKTETPVRTSLSSDARLQQMREAFVEVGLKGLAILFVWLFALTVWRIFKFPSNTGWQLSFGLVVSVAIIFFLAFFFRAKLPYRFRASLLVVSFLVGGAAGLPAFGFAGGGSMAWFVTGCFVAAVIFPRRVSIAAIAFVISVLLVAAYAFVSGWHTTSVNMNIMLVQPAAWASVLLSVAATTGIMAMALGAYSRANYALLQDVDLQRQQIEYMATHDNLTGLPVLRTVVDRCDMAIHQAQRTRQKLALMFIDLDGFKQINDTFGHEAGDHVLKEVAARLKSNVRSADTAARIGGDEFVVLLTALDHGEMAGEVAGKLIRAVGLPIDYQGQKLQVGASVGIGIFPDHAADTHSLRKVADQAMYTVKKSGKNQFAFCSQ